MIRQMCGKCRAVNAVPEGSAGTTAPCSKCGAALDVPAAYAPTVASDGGVPAAPDAPKPLPPLPLPPAVPAPPPGLNLAVLAPKPIADAPAASPPTGNGPGVRVALDPRWLDWVPVAAVTAALLATFFFWVGSYPGGVRVYGQGPWSALVGDDIDAIALPDVTGDEKEIVANLRGSRWLIAYLPLLLAAVPLFWLERVFRNPTVATVPGPLAWLPGLWPRRFPLLTGVAVALLLLLAMQAWRGFGLENAVRAKVNAQFAEAEAKADTTPARQTVAVAKGRELAKYQLHGTTALDAALLLHAAAALGMAARWWLHRRGGKPLPAVEFHS